MKLKTSVAGALLPLVKGHPHVRFTAHAVDHPGVPHGTFAALEALCTGGCKVPETCYHVRAALAHGADIPLVAPLLEANDTLRVRIPLANRLWVVAQITPVQVFFNDTLNHPLPFTMEGRGIEDVKWLLVNNVAAKVDHWIAHNEGMPRCRTCGEPRGADINAEPDFAWVVAWASSTFRNSCYYCVRNHAVGWYRNRSSTIAVAEMSPMNKDW